MKIEAKSFEITMKFSQFCALASSPNFRLVSSNFFSASPCCKRYNSTSHPPKIHAPSHKSCSNYMLLTFAILMSCPIFFCEFNITTPQTSLQAHDSMLIASLALIWTSWFHLHASQLTVHDLQLLCLQIWTAMHWSFHKSMGPCGRD